MWFGVGEKSKIALIVYASCFTIIINTIAGVAGTEKTRIQAARALGANEGLGYLIYTAHLYFHTDWILIGIITLGLMGYVSDKILKFIGKKLLKRFGISEENHFEQAVSN